MKDKISKKGLILIISLVVIILLLIIFMYIIPNTKKDNKPINTNEPTIKVNDNKGVTEEKNVNGFVFSNTSIVFEDGLSTLSTTVTNNSASDYTNEKFNIIIKDKKGKEIVTIPGYLSKILEKGTSQKIFSSIDIDLSKEAFDLEFKEINN